jgi:hypothetical protein
MRAREYFWFALVLLVLLMGSTARAGTSNGGAAAPTPKPTVPAAATRRLQAVPRGFLS